MQASRFLVAATVGGLLGLAAPVACAQGVGFVLTGAHVLDEGGNRWLDSRSVVVLGDSIASVTRDAGRTVPLEAEHVDLTGLWLVPGLVDLHTHLLLHPYDETPWDEQVLREPLEQRTIRATLAARRTLEAGFTTIRDLGTEGAGFADVALRDAVAQGWIPGPRILAVTRAIVATGCYAPAGYDPRWSLPQGAQEATGVDEVRRVVRQQVSAGADWIKVYADYPRVRGEAATATFSQAELDALVDEATTAGRRVSAHAVSPEGIRRAVMAGAETIEHGYGATSDVLDLMHDRGVVLCPTLAANEAMARYAGWKPGDPEPARVRDVRATFSRALRSRVTIACGSDAGVFAHGDNAREIELMVAYGMPPADALRAATRVAALVLDPASRDGRIAAGATADLVAVQGDPLHEPSALRDPVLVIQAGRIVVDHRSSHH